jgi:ribosomal protein S12 methylthiotransferase accessory factor
VLSRRRSCDGYRSTVVRGQLITRMENGAAFIDSRFGPIVHAQKMRIGDGEPFWWLATAQLARHPVGNIFTESPASGAGTSLDVDEAVGRAIGEALERYCGLNWHLDLIAATLRETSLLGRWPRCAPDEPTTGMSGEMRPDDRLTFVRGQRVIDDSFHLIPAGFVAMGFEPVPPEPVVAFPISTGLAFHPRRCVAIWNALCEVIERDAVMSAWWIHRPLREIDMAAAPGIVTRRLRRLDACGMKARIFDITTELGVPTVFCVLTSDRYPRLVVSAATKASPALACAKALDEVVSMRVALRSDRDAADLGSGKPDSLVDHARYYASVPDHPAFDFIAPGVAERSSYPEFAARQLAQPDDDVALHRAISLIEQQDVTVLWVDLTTPDVHPMGTVVRVVVPEAVPLSPHDDARWLATKRLLMRSGTAQASRDAFTPHPHPFA